ncbi:hypothetical protein EGM88_13545 [Aureibaculum marinum]|uniref:Lipoprotein n=1 Tax=Aureibaculum marinum TaxID=2487930 RepID=A0A3N4NA59_9FLAO|nr:DUF6174 domain-containing protein [Aureibaculum marinum]RPD93252.1 hypothetical protein EGM88_13545 [Aureibaculum marinum]
MRNLNFTLVLALSILFISCDADNELKSDFEMAKEKWQSYQFEHYTVQENLSCFCSGLLEWTLKVTNNKKDTVYFENSKLYKGQTYQMVLTEAKTIEDAFEFIENFDKDNVASFNVIYDEKYGYPKSIAIDYQKELADDEITYIYSNFIPLSK